MRCSYYIAAGIALAAALSLAFNVPANAATICNIFNGCIGTSTPPAYGQLLIGGKNGEYELVASSTLGDVGNAASSTLLIDNNTFLGSVVFATTTTGSLNGVVTVSGFPYPQTTAGINQAICAVIPTSNTNGEVMLSPGIYRGGSVNYRCNNTNTGVHLKLIGSGIGATTIKLSNYVATTTPSAVNLAVVEGYPQQITQSLNLYSNASSTVEIADMTLDYNGQNQNVNGVVFGILGDNTFSSTYLHNIMIKNVFVPSFNKGTPAYGIGFDNYDARGVTDTNLYYLNDDEDRWITGYTAGLDISNISTNNYYLSATDSCIYDEDGAGVTIAYNYGANCTYGIFGATLSANDQQTILFNTFATSTVTTPYDLNSTNIAATLSNELGDAGFSIFNRERIYFNGNDINWALGKADVSTNDFTNATTTNGVELTIGSGGNNGFSVGTHQGNSILEVMGNSGNVYFRNSIGIGTTTPGSLLSVQGVANFTTGTSTLEGTGGLNLTNGGCFAVNGTCIVTNGASSTLLSDNNTFSGVDTFTNTFGNFAGTWQGFAPSHFLTGNQTVTLSGDVSGSGSTAITTAIGSNKVTLPDIAQVAAHSLLVNNTGSTGNLVAVATSSLGLTTSAFASPNVSQWTNDAGYLTSLSGAASSTLLGDNNTLSGLNIFSKLLSLIPTSNGTALFVQDSSLAATIASTSGIYLQNPTAAAAGAQQNSPAITFEGQGWGTTAPASSTPVEYDQYVVPVQGTTVPSANLIWGRSISSTPFTTVMTLTSGGVLEPINIEVAAGVLGSTNSTNGNFWVPAAAIATHEAAISQYAFATSSTNSSSIRVGMYGFTSTALTAGDNYADVVIGNAPITTPATGNNNWLANLVLKPIGSVTQGAAVVGNTATLYLEGAATTTVTGKNYELYASSTAPDYFGGNVGINTPTPNFNFEVQGTASSTILDATTANIGTLNLTNPLAVAQGGTGLTSSSQNFFFAGPTSGSGAPTWRAIVAGDIPTLNQNTTGSAATLTTARTINNVAFDGSANITITAASSSLLTDNNTFSGLNIFTNAHMILASTTIGNGTQAGGLTVNGSATTTGNAYFAGNVGIGTTSPAPFPSVVDVFSSIGSSHVLLGTQNFGSQGAIGFNTTLSGTNYAMAGDSGTTYLNGVSSLKFRINNGDKAIINGTGFGIGTTNPAQLLQVAGTVYATSTNTTGSVTMSGLTAGSTGDYVCDNAGVIENAATTCSISSEKVKNSISDLASDAGLAAILELNPVTFRYDKGFGDSGTAEQVGLIAEPTASVDPLFAQYATAPMETPNGTIEVGQPDGINWEAITSATILAIQQQQAEIDALQGGVPLPKQNHEDEFLWGAIGLLVVWNGYLTFRRK